MTEDPSHGAIVVLYAPRPSPRSPDFIVFPYRSIDPFSKKLSPPELRLVAGTNKRKEHRNEKIEETGQRKLLEELYLEISIERLTYLDKKVFPNDSSHVRHALLGSYADCKGAIRTTPITMPDGDWLGVPRRLPAPYALKEISLKHLWACELACRELGVRIR